MEEIGEGFAALSGGVVRGCVGALHGMNSRAHHQAKQNRYRQRPGLPKATEKAVTPSCSKAFAMERGDFCMGSSSAAYGNTHDSQAFKMSELTAKLESGPLPPGYYIVGDEA